MRSYLRPMLIIMILVCCSMACELTNMVQFLSDPRPLWVDRVDVVPAESSGKFSVAVVLFSHTQEDTLLCKYNNFRGNQDTVFQQTVPPLDEATTLRFEFTLTQPGNYNLTCTPQKSGISNGTTFIVTAAQTSTISPAQTPTLTPVIMADFFFSACAFLDANNNQVWDASDTPIEGAQMGLKFNEGQAFVLGDLTNSDGCAQVWMPGDRPEPPYTIRMDPPADSGLIPIGESEVIYQAGPSPRFLFRKP
jgi:hypothetical protein